MPSQSPDAVTHIVVGKAHVRSSTRDDGGRYEPGDPIDPTEAELRSFPHRFVEVDADGRVVEDDDAEPEELSPEEQAVRTYRQRHLDVDEPDPDSDTEDAAESDDTADLEA